MKIPDHWQCSSLLTDKRIKINHLEWSLKRQERANWSNLSWSCKFRQRNRLNQGPWPNPFHLDSSRKICSNKITLGNREQSTREEQTRNLALTPRAELTVRCFNLLDSEMEYKYFSSKYHQGICGSKFIPISKCSAEMIQLSFSVPFQI